MAKLNSKKHLNISYTEGEELFFLEDEVGLSFSFEVEGEITENSESMDLVANALDNVDTLKSTAIAYLKSALANTRDDDYQLVHDFLSDYEDDMETEDYQEMLGIDEDTELSLDKMIDRFTINRFGSYIDPETNEQMFVIDLSFDPEYTDQLMVINFDINKKIVSISHES